MSSENEVLTQIKGVFEDLQALHPKTIKVMNNRQALRLKGSVLEFEADALIEDVVQDLLGVVRTVENEEDATSYIMILVHCWSMIQALAVARGLKAWDLHLFLLVPDSVSVGQVLDMASHYGSRYASIGITALQFSRGTEGEARLAALVRGYREFLMKRERFREEYIPVMQFFAPLLPLVRASSNSADLSMLNELKERLRHAVLREVGSRTPRDAVTYAGEALPEMAGPALDLLDNLTEPTCAAKLMEVRRVKIGSFRALSDSEARLGKITMVLGGNATGKTSLIEAIELALCGSVERLNGLRGAEGEVLENLAEREPSGIDGMVEATVSEPAGERTSCKFKMRRDVRGSESPYLDTFRSAILRQSDLWRFVECKPEDRAAETLNILGVNVRAVREACDNLLRSYTDTLRGFLSVVTNAGFPLPVSQVSIGSSNVTKCITGFVTQLAHLPERVECREFHSGGQIGQCLEDLFDALKRVAEDVKTVLAYLENRQGAPQEVVLQIQSDLALHDQTVSRARKLVSERGALERALEELRLVAKKIPGARTTQVSVSRANELSKQLLECRKTLRLAQLLSKSIDFRPLLEQVAVSEANITSFVEEIDRNELQLVTDEGMKAVVRQCAERIVRIRSSLERLRGEITEFLNTGLDMLVHQMVQKITEEMDALSTELATTTEHQEKTPAAVLAQVAEPLSRAGQMLGLENEVIELIESIDLSNTDRILRAAQVMEAAVNRLNELQGTLARIPVLSQCSDAIMDICAGYRDGRPRGLLAAAIAFDVTKTVKELIIEESDRVVAEMVDGKCGLMLLEILSALSVSRWAQLPQILRYEGARGTRRPQVHVEVASPSGRRPDVRYVINFSEAGLLGLSWFLVGYLLQAKTRSNVVLIDDPFVGMDPAHQEFAAKSLLRIVRLCAPDAQVVLAVPSRDCIEDLVRCVFPRPVEEQGSIFADSLPDVAVIECRRVSSAQCRFTDRVGHEIGASLWSDHFVLDAESLAGLKLPSVRERAVAEIREQTS